MLKRILVCCTVGVAMAAAVGVSEAQYEAPHASVTLGQDHGKPQPTGPRPGDPISFCGKVVALVEQGCVGIVGQSQTVELSSVTPKPAPGSLISGVGVFGDEMNICMQGLHMRSATWKVTKSCD